MVDLNDEAGLRAAIETFYFAYREFTGGPDRILAQRGLGRVHHRILYFVGQQPDLSVKSLLQVLAITKQALHAPLRQLIEMGLVLSAGDSADGRVRRLRLSGEGVRLEARLTATQMKLLAGAFAQAGSGSAAAWHKVMKAVGAGAISAGPGDDALSAESRSASPAARRRDKAPARRAG
jgi:DNA-binding MarR family transcriptional regulator